VVLTKEAERLDVPFQFNHVVYWLDALGMESLRVKTGEALAITSSLQLHRLLAFDDDSTAAVGDNHNGPLNNQGKPLTFVKNKLKRT
jgi:hypothetical protein